MSRLVFRVMLQIFDQVAFRFVCSVLTKILCMLGIYVYGKCFVKDIDVAFKSECVNIVLRYD